MGALLSFALGQANDPLPGAALASSLDASDNEPGLPLAFSRTFLQTLTGRYALGPLGRGWTELWDISLSTDSAGNVDIQESGVDRIFSLQADGTYEGSAGDYATLTQDQGLYRLQETDGTAYAFGADGKLDHVEDTNGNRITAVYTGDELTSLVHSKGDRLTFSYDAQGRISQMIDASGRITTYGYNASDEHLTSVTGPGGTTTYQYSTATSGPTAHELLSISYPDGTHQYFAYDDRGRLIQESLDGGAETVSFSFDTTGEVTITDATGASTKLLFNDLGLVGQAIDALGHGTIYQYDANGNLVQLTGPDGISYSYSYDSRGNLISQSDPLGDRVNYTYDPTLNRLLTVEDARGNTTNYHYDPQGDLLSITYPNGDGEQFQYNPLGQLTESINGRGDPIDYVYNNAGLLTRKTYADGTHVDYTYDSHQNLISATDSTGTTTLAYDSADRLTKITYPSGQFLEFTYDAGGRRTQSVDQDGFTVNYSYDAADRLSELKDGNGNLIVQYTYDAAGNLIQKTNGNGTYTTYTYDADGNVLSITNHASASGPVNSFDIYTYDALGNVLTDTNQNGEWVYTYDADSQLIHAVFTPNNSDPDVLTAQDIQYVYDPAGNRISETVNGVVTTYAVNNVNEYTSSTTNGITTSHQYDAAGNLIQEVSPQGTTNYTFDEENRLTGVAGPAGAWNYEYDAFGNLIATTHDGQTTDYLVDPAGLGNVVGEYGSSGLIAHYTYGLGLVSRTDATGSAAYYDFDALGSTVGLTGSGGNYLNRYSYLPFGESLMKTDAIPNPFTYIGEWGVMGEGNGLDFMRARFYTPAEGRFLNTDPIGQAGGVNLYKYCYNNPVGFADPSGTQQIHFNSASDNSIIINGNKTVNISNANNAAQKGGEVKSSFEAEKTMGDLEKAAAENDLYGNNPRGGDTNTFYCAGGDVLFWIWYASVWYDLGNDAELAYFKSLFDASRNGEVHLLAIKQYHPNPTTGGPGYDEYTIYRIFDDDWTVWQKIKVPVVAPRDPNDKVGPGGVGDVSFVSAISPLSYTIDFENTPTASAPAQVVTITDQLDSNLDWRTLQLGAIVFDNQQIAVPAGLSFYTTMVDLRPYGQDLLVQIDAGIDPAAGVVHWTFASIDPDTGVAPANPLVGFLPPDDANHSGEGYVTYTIQPKSGMPTGTIITNQATITFDTQPSMDTNPTSNVLDATAPSSTVAPLPATSDDPNFTVSWSGVDDANGSGLASYTIFVSTDGGPFKPWLQNTTLTSSTYHGAPGHTYAFYSVATDSAGNREATPTAPEATTQVPGTSVATTTTVQSSEDPSKLGDLVTFTATVSPALGTIMPTGTVQFSIDGTALDNPATLNNGSATLTTSALGVGSHTVTAAYTCDTGQSIASRGTLADGQTVNQATPTVSVTAPDATYDGTAHGATVSSVTGVSGANLAPRRRSPTTSARASAAPAWVAPLRPTWAPTRWSPTTPAAPTTRRPTRPRRSSMSRRGQSR